MNKIFIAFCVIIMCSCTKKLDFWENSYGNDNIRIKRLNNCEGEIYRINKTDDVLNFTNWPTSGVTFDYHRDNSLVLSHMIHVDMDFRKLHSNNYHIDTINWCLDRLGEGKYQFYFSDEIWKEKVGPIDFENKATYYNLTYDTIEYDNEAIVKLYFTNNSKEKILTKDLDIVLDYQDETISSDKDGNLYRTHLLQIDKSKYKGHFNKKFLLSGEQGYLKIKIPVSYINHIDLKKCPKIYLTIKVPTGQNIFMWLNNNILGIGDCKK